MRMNYFPKIAKSSGFVNFIKKVNHIVIHGHFIVIDRFKTT